MPTANSRHTNAVVEDQQEFERPSHLVGDIRGLSGSTDLVGTVAIDSSHLNNLDTAAGFVPKRLRRARRLNR